MKLFRKQEEAVADDGVEADGHGPPLPTLLMHRRKDIPCCKLLAHLQSEYIQMKEAQLALQAHCSKWMHRVEQLMQQQEHVTGHMSLRGQTSSAHLNDVPDDVPDDVPVVSPKVQPSILQQQTSSIMSWANGISPPIHMPRAPSSENAAASFEDNEARRNAPSHSSSFEIPGSRLVTPMGSPLPSARTCSEPMPGKHCFAPEPMLPLPADDLAKDDDISARDQSLHKTWETFNRNHTPSRQPLKPAAVVCRLDEHLDPDDSRPNSFESCTIFLQQAAQSSNHPTKLCKGSTETRNTDLQADLDSLPNDGTPAMLRWADFVINILQSNKKQLRSLRPAWIQNDAFIQKASKVQHGQGLTAGLDMINNGRSRVQQPTIHGAMTGIHKVVQVAGNKTVRRFTVIMNPTSHKRMAWVIIGMCLMLYDLVAFPLMVFDPPNTPFTHGMKWFSQIYWTLDIYISFMTGININGELCLDPKTIAWYYAKTWLPFDLSVTIPLWPILVLNWESGDTMKSVRYVRFLRFLRLIRLAKLEHLLSEALEFINSSIVILSFGIVKLMVYLMLLNHFNACIWYAIGARENGWVHSWDGSSSDTKTYNRDMAYKYFSAMHWSLTQFQGTSEIVPGQTLSERIYAVVFLLFALMILASFVSSLTNMMMQLQSLKDEKIRCQRAIQSYLSMNKISCGLSMRVKKYVEWKLQMLSSQKSNADVLELLPTNLVVELFYEVRAPALNAHGFFASLDEAHTRTFRKLCHEKLTLMWQAPMETMFTTADEAKQMYFITSGLLRYTVTLSVRSSAAIQLKRQPTADTLQSPSSMASPPPGADVNESGIRSATEDIRKGACLSEPVLWVDWEHCGDLKTVTDTAVLALGCSGFAEVLQTSHAAHASAVLYARQFVEVLNGYGKVFTDYLPEGGIVDMTGSGGDTRIRHSTSAMTRRLSRDSRQQHLPRNQSDVDRAPI